MSDTTESDRPHRRRSFFGDVVAVGTTRVAVILLNVVTGILIAQALGAEGRGIVAAVTVIPIIAASFAELGVRQASAYMLGRRLESDEDIVATVSVLGILVTAAVALICIGYFALTWNESYDPLLVSMALLMVPGQVIVSYASGIFLGRERIAAFNQARWLVALVNLLLVATLVAWAGFGPWAAVFAQATGGLTISVYAVWLVSRIVPIRFKIDPGLVSRLFRLGLSYAAAMFVLEMFYRVNLVLLQQVSTFEQVGIFALGASLAEYVWQVPATMGALVFSRGANAKDPDAFSRKVIVLMRVSFVFSVLGACAIALFGPFVIPLVYGRDFAGSVGVLNVLLPGVVCFITFKTLNMDLVARGKPRVAMAMAIPCLLLNVVLTLILSPRFGAMGAAVATTAAYASGGVLFTILYCRTLGVPLGDVLLFRRTDLTFLLERVPYGQRILSRFGPVTRH